MRACNAAGCSGWTDMSTPYQLWTYLPCYDTGGTSCSGGGSPLANGHSH